MSIDFEPVKVAPRRRRVDPLAIGLVIVVIALATAVAKPWDAGRDARTRAPSSAVVASTSVLDRSFIPDATVSATNPVADLAETWVRLAAAVGARDIWGIAAVLDDGRSLLAPSAARRYVTRWSPTTTDASGGWTADVARDDRSIVVLGVTVPPGETPVAARIWRLHTNDQLEWMDAERLPLSSRTLLFLQPGSGGSPYEAWEAGQYRIDVLVRGGVRRIAVQIPGRFDNVPPTSDWVYTRQGIIPASMSDPPAVISGMFAFVDGTGVSLLAKPYRPLDDEEAWRDTAGVSTVVASAYLPRASALGVMFPSGASVEVATLRRLAPNGPFEPPRANRGNSDRRGRSPFVLFEAPPGGVWAPGVYSVSVTWTLGASTHRDTWHAELRPGPRQQ